MVIPTTLTLTLGSRPEWLDVRQVVNPARRSCQNAFGDSGYESHGEEQYECEWQR